MKRTTEEHFVSHWLANRGFVLVAPSSSMFSLLAGHFSSFKPTLQAFLGHRTAHQRSFAITSLETPNNEGNERTPMTNDFAISSSVFEICARAKFTAEPSDDWEQLFETTCLERRG